MTRLIDADALLEAMEKSVKYEAKYGDWLYQKDALAIITNAPTIQRESINEVYEFEKWLNEKTLIKANLNIELDYADPLAEIAYKSWKARSKINIQTVQREGWVSVVELQRLYDDMFIHKDLAITVNSLFKLINHE